MDNGLAGRFFSYSCHNKVFTAFADACLGMSQLLEAHDGADPRPCTGCRWHFRAADVPRAGS
jgi:hypothetical protein